MTNEGENKVEGEKPVEPPCEQVKDEMVALAQKKQDLEKGLRQINRAKKTLPENNDIDKTIKHLEKEIQTVDEQIQEAYTRYVICDNKQVTENE